MPAKAQVLVASLLIAQALSVHAEVEHLGEKPRPASPGIPVVDSEEKLDALEPLKLFDGWDVRLAMAPGTFTGKPADPKAAPDFSHSPWRILYVDFRRIKKGAEFPRSGTILGGEPIGPFEYKLDYDPDARFDRAILEELLMERVETIRLVSDHYLFAAVIPCAAKGGYRLRIYPTFPEVKPELAKKREDQIGETLWKQDSPIPLVWTEFAKTHYVNLPDLGIPTPDLLTIPFLPYAPEFDGHQSLVGGRIEKEKAPEAEGGTPIKGMVPHLPDPGFIISLSGAGIAIALAEPASTGIENFLARWWIDGKPVAWTFDEIPPSKVLEELKRMQEAHLNEKVFTTRIPFRPPAALEGAKPDSKVTLQLLYSPTGTKELPNPGRESIDELKQMRELFKRNDLRLSNRLEFKLSDFVGSK